MVGPSKILTVSYGTFSCTLEGFDDPFSTMRGIAEYFRDLAADDRYFGAEPPTPDAEMLHRIAEREIQRRVEARVDDTGITLRQIDDQKAAPAQSTRDDVAKPAAPVAAPVAEAAPERAPVKEAAFFQKPAAQAPADTVENSVAAKLARIRAAVSVRESDNDVSYVEDAQLSVETATIASAFVSGDEDADVEAEEETLVAAEEAVSHDEHVELTEDDQVEITVLETEEFTAEADEEPTSDLDEAVAASDEVVEAVDDVVEASDEAEDDRDAMARVMNELSDDDANAEAEEEFAAAEEPDSGAIARVIKMRRADFDAAVESGDLEEIEDEAEAISDEEIVAEADEFEAIADEEVVAEDDDEDDEMSMFDDEDTTEETSTVEEDESIVAETDVELAADEDDDEYEEIDDEEHVAAFGAADDFESDLDDEDTSETELSEEDEAELMATLAMVQKENDAENRADKEGRALWKNQDLEENGNAVERILEVTNNELEETEGTRRRSAIAHLKAAVLATRADKKIAKAKEDEDADEMNQYRDDLARVVRPRRPTESMKTTERRMPPLMLVSEQRIDKTEQASADTDNAPRAVVSPRRVNIADDDGLDGSNVTDQDGNIFEDSSSFAEYAEQMGATELPDLLEAAAAYASYVEGRPHFSRPQIMKAVLNFDESKEFSREDGLRSFGQLLRRGKIQKLNRGQFTISQSTRFNPEARAAGE